MVIWSIMECSKMLPERPLAATTSWSVFVVPAVERAAEVPRADCLACDRLIVIEADNDDRVPPMYPRYAAFLASIESSVCRFWSMIN